MSNPVSSIKSIKIAIVLIVIVIVGLLLYFFSNKRPIEIMPKILSQEEIIKKQTEELDKLRQESAANPLTEAEN